MQPHLGWSFEYYQSGWSQRRRGCDVVQHAKSRNLFQKTYFKIEMTIEHDTVDVHEEMIENTLREPCMQLFVTVFITAKCECAVHLTCQSKKRSGVINNSPFTLLATFVTLSYHKTNCVQEKKVSFHWLHNVTKSDSYAQ